MEDIRVTRIELTDSSNNSPVSYTMGSLTVKLVSTIDSFDAGKVRYYVYGENLFPMCNSTEASMTGDDGRYITVAMYSYSVWMPGKYFLLVSYDGSHLWRVDFELDDTLRARITSHQYLDPWCREDILANCLSARDEQWKKLSTLPGTARLRYEALRFEQFNLWAELVQQKPGPELLQPSGYIITTPDKEVPAEALELFHALVDGAAGFHIASCQSLYDAALQNPYENLNNLIVEHAGKTVCLTGVGAMLTTGGRVIVKHLTENVANRSMTLWLSGTRQEVDSLLETYPSLRRFFSQSRTLAIEQPSAFEMVQTFTAQLEAWKLILESEVCHELVCTIMAGCDDGTLTNWRTTDVSRFIQETVYPSFLARTLDEGCAGTLGTLEVEDLHLDQLHGRTSTYEASISELNQMVGLDDIKQAITTTANRTKFYIERRRLGLKTDDSAPQHAIFIGNPGTGKTTVARMLGKIYHSMGLLSRGEVVSVDRTRIVGRFIGETEENMKVLLEEARGNVLFIDEAYTLYDGASDRKDFGCRAIDCLLTVLNQPNPDMLIIFAGYAKEMDALMSTNPGLVGRFPNKYSFKDYTADQLMLIAEHLFSRDEYVLTEEARQTLRKTIRQTLEQRTPNFGNARWVEQYVRNGIIPALADRMSQRQHPQRGDYQRIEAVDVEKAYERFNPKMIELKPRQRVGFSA